MPRNNIAPVVLDYMSANADRPIHSTTLAEELKLKVTSVQGAMNRMQHNFPQMRRIQRGIYIWDSEPKVIEHTEYMVKVLNKKDDGTMLAQDIEDSSNLFIMKPIDY
jgi:hypothetical protein